MRPIFKCLRAALLVACLGVAGHAQIIGDSETPDSPGDGGGDHLPVPCVTCCNQVPVDPACSQFCGCSTQTICPSYIGLQSPAVRATNIPAIYRSIEETRDRMSGTARGKVLLSAWETHAGTVVTLFQERPALAQRVGKALVAHWPTDIWTGDGTVVEEAALRELRMISRLIARAAAQSGEKNLATVIRDHVVPRLDATLAGRSPADAFKCFISDGGC